jgi:SAM-dependent methyltransferase
VNDANIWHEAWREGKTRWNIGAPHPFAAEVLQWLNQQNKETQARRMYVPGCGHAHDAAFFAQAGFQTVGADFVEEAHQAALALYGSHANLELRNEDVMAVRTSDTGIYDVVFDRAMLNAIPENARASYMAACGKRLKKGGLFVSILITETCLEPSPPPYAISQVACKEVLEKNGFQRLFWEDRSDGFKNPVVLAEAITYWQKTEC